LLQGSPTGGPFVFEGVWFCVTLLLHPHGARRVEQELEQKLLAKRFTEHIKLLVTTFNAIGLVIFGAGS
jgi:hypothetical protein